MVFESNPIAIAMLASAVLSMAVTGYCLFRRNNPGALRLAILMAAVGGWALGGMLEAAAVEKADKILWATWTYLGIVATPVFWLLFAARFARRDHRLPQWLRWALWAVPAVTVALVFTNDGHHLIWGTIEPGPNPTVLVYEHGAWFWVNTAYSYLLLLAGTYLLAVGIRRTEERHSSQTILLILGAALPWLGNAAYLAGWVPLAGLDPTPLILMASGTLIGAAILRFGLLDLLPLARDAVVEGMSDAILVVDDKDRIVDFNPAARELFPEMAEAGIGQPVGRHFLAWSAISERSKSASESHAELQLGGASPRTMDVRTSVLHGAGGRVIGRLIALRDITTRIQMEQALREVQMELIQKEERYRALVENAPFAVMISTLAGGEILYINPRGEEAFGLVPGTGAGRTDLPFYAHPEDREELAAFFAKTPSGIAERTLEFRRADGTVLRALISFSRLHFAGKDALFESFLDLDRLTRR